MAAAASAPDVGMRVGSSARAGSAKAEVPPLIPLASAFEGSVCASFPLTWSFRCVQDRTAGALWAQRLVLIMPYHQTERAITKRLRC